MTINFDIHVESIEINVDCGWLKIILKKMPKMLKKKNVLGKYSYLLLFIFQFNNQIDSFVIKLIHISIHNYETVIFNTILNNNFK